MKSATEQSASAWQKRARTACPRQIALAVLATVTCGGCVSIGKCIDPETLAQVKIGVSTRADVEELLGSPRTVSDSPTGGVTLTYFHHRGWLIPPGQMIATGLGLSKVPYGGLAGSALKRVWTGGSSKMECVSVTFDGNGTVSDVSTFEMESEHGDALLDRNRQSVSWKSRSEAGLTNAEGAPGESGHRPENAEPAWQPRDTVSCTLDTVTHLEARAGEYPSILDLGPENDEKSVQPNDAVDGCSIEGNIIVSRNDDRFPKMAEAIDGIAIKIKDTDADPDADIDVYRDGKRILRLRNERVGGRAFVVGRSGTRYELHLLDIEDETETVRVRIIRCN